MKPFFDRAKLHLIAGDGGNGCLSFRREKFVPFGGPDGGDGGKGADVIIKVNSKLSTLADFHYKKEYKAPKGVHGTSSNCHGKKGQDLVLFVPPGTQIYDEEGVCVADMLSPEDEFHAVKGGRGGRGNARFASSVNRAPRRFEEGKPGEDKQFFLEMKLIADVGIIGFPNAGKSTFLAHATRANPKIANYPFTTLSPNLGVYITIEGRHVVFSDIPGLIEGASKGEGLGHEFLKHIQRTAVLMHMIDVSFKQSADEIIQTYQTIRKELNEYDEELSSKQEIVVFNKIDMISDEENGMLDEAQQFFEDQNLPVFLISAYIGKGLKPLVSYILSDVL